MRTQHLMRAYSNALGVVRDRQRIYGKASDHYREAKADADALKAELDAAIESGRGDQLTLGG